MRTWYLPSTRSSAGQSRTRLRDDKMCGGAEFKGIVHSSWSMVRFHVIACL
jgi:hypothetical protein